MYVMIIIIINTLLILYRKLALILRFRFYIKKLKN
jgi:hypothetical protein